MDLQSIKTSLESQLCPVHGKHVLIDEKPGGIDIVRYCCEPFHKTMQARADVLVEQGFKEALDRASHPD